MEASDETWKAPPNAGATSMLPELLDQGETREPGNASELRGKLRDASGPVGTGDFCVRPDGSAAVFEQDNFYHHRAVSRECEKGPRDGDQIQERTMGVEPKALNQEAAAGLISLIEREGGSLKFNALLANKTADREPAKSPDRLVQKAEQTPTAADSTTPSSQHLGAWAEEMASDFGELEADETFYSENPPLTAGRTFHSFEMFDDESIVHDSHSRVRFGRDKARRAALG